MDKKPATATTTATSTSSDTDDIKPAKKIERVLSHLVKYGSINRLKAEKAPVFDHSLSSTMSNEIKQRLWLEFAITPEKAIGYDGLRAIYHRYTLTAKSTETAKQIISECRIKCCAKPTLWEGAA